MLQHLSLKNLEIHEGRGECRLETRKHEKGRREKGRKTGRITGRQVIGSQEDRVIL